MNTHKLISIGILLLFAGLYFFPIAVSTSVETNHQMNNVGDVIIVDNEGDGDYTSIKEAVGNVSSGDIIMVYSGTYYEYNITISTSDITLRGMPYELGGGSDAGKPFIDGEGFNFVLIIEAKRVVISGFKIENYRSDPSRSVVIGISEGADDCVISDNDIGHSILDCIVIQSSNNHIINNSISRSILRRGICILSPSKNNAISGNVISDIHTMGIVLSNSSGNVITRNHISRCHIGIDVIAGSHNTIMENTIEDNEVGGIDLVDTSYNIIENNNFFRNWRHAGFEVRWFAPLLHNTWHGNYWGRPHIFPKPIIGYWLFFPIRVNFDWRPALRPYDISVNNDAEYDC